MKYLYAPTRGLVLLLMNLLPLPLLLPMVMVGIALIFAKWDTVPTKPLNHSAEDDVLLIQGDLPKAAWFLGTPDQRLPGDTSIKEVKAIYDKYGRFICSWLWLGQRNTFMNLASRWGHETTDFAPEGVMGLWERGNDWKYTKKIGKVLFITGYNIYKRENGTFVAAPVFTFKWAPAV